MNSAEIEARFRNAARSTTLRNLINRYGLAARAVLDIGCCYGEHVAQFGPESTGLTINPEEATVGSARGYDIRHANAETDIPIDRTYEIIYSNNLLEHLYSPHGFLYKLRDTLSTDGRLILGVPVIPFPRVLMRIRKFRGSLADAHINFFTTASLVLTVERAGWAVEEVRGFHFNSRFLDALVRPFYPHVYVVTKVDANFEYSKKRQVELAGYE